MSLQTIQEVNSHIVNILQHTRSINYKLSSSEQSIYLGLLMLIQNFKSRQMSYDDFKNFSLLEKSSIRKILCKLEKLGFLERVFLDSRKNVMFIKLHSLGEIKEQQCNR